MDHAAAFVASILGPALNYELVLLVGFVFVLEIRAVLYRRFRRHL